jgi:cytochrome oxidase Cu insertion factor (SCO1/SenC/PrrC family)
MNEEVKKKNKITLVLLGLFFASPLVLSWFVFNYTDYLEMRGTSNRGELIQPPKQLGDLALIDPFDEERKESLFDKWSLVYVADSCDETCMESVYLIRQIHARMDKHSLRVQRVLLLTAEPVEILKEKLSDYAGQQLINNEIINVEQLVNKFKLTDSDKPLDANRIYIVDPLGNLMMNYKSDTKPGDIYKDLKKLLRGSRIG